MEWKITDKEIQALWTEIWPKIVAIGWLDDLDDQRNTNHLHPPDESSYRDCFENSASFRRKEVKRVADTLTEHGMLRLQWDSNIPIGLATKDNDLDLSIAEAVNIISELIEQKYPIKKGSHSGADSGDTKETSDRNGSSDPPDRYKWSCSNALYGNTYFYLNHKGIVLPWPITPPDQRRIFVGYAQGGGALPRSSAHGGPPWNGGLNPSQDKLFDDLTSNIDWDSTPSEENKRLPTTGLTGVALITLFEKWGEEVGTAWAYDGQGVPNQIRNNVKDHIMPEVWTNWPSNEEGNHYVTAEAVDGPDFILEGNSELGPTDPSIQLKVPLPAPPPTQAPDRETIFKELIVGQATNPMYSNCY